MSNYGKTYPLGSSEAMKREPRLDEEYYLQAVGYRNKEGQIESPLEFTRKHLKVLEDMYLEDSINERYNLSDMWRNF